ncbi:FHA domain-containing protein [Microbacterium sp. CIAB417]|uniref:FHA domain-containing protein n=1 Tax=Microbacterium sp. CIAB417 TaxID=2860287 RepID=UPI001FADD67D|nr:FHA domain-containing protein [Microbacterium sp. CIAB417]
MQTNYRPGSWNALVVPGALVALPPEVPHALVSTLWERLNDERTLAAVVDAITDSAGGSFTAMPPFVAAVREGANVRVAVRGDIVAEVTGSDGLQTLSGADVTTWSERFIPGADRVVLRLSADAGEAEFPVLGGIVRAAEVSADLEPGDGSAAEAAAGGAAPEAESALAAEAAVAPAFAAAVPPPPVVPLPAPVTDETPSAPEDATAEETDALDEVDGTDAGTEEPDEQAAVETDQPAVEPEETSADAATAAIDVDPAAPAEASDDVVSDQTLIPAEQTLGSDFDEFQQLFGDTVHSVPSAPPAPPVAGDHDGATISVAEARALRGDLPPVPQIEPEAATALMPAVGGGRIRVSTGQVVALDRTVVIGRRPRAPRASGASLPHLIAVESPQQDISRSHLEIRPEGDTVVVIDLHTTNGSTLLRPGADPVRLHPGEQTLVLSGDVIDLGDGVTVAFEDLP